MESSLDALGQFSFEALPAGEYVVKLSGYGYDLGAAQNVALAEDESLHWILKFSSILGRIPVRMEG